MEKGVVIDHLDQEEVWRHIQSAEDQENTRQQLRDKGLVVL